jgi:TonB-dependent SusC/RagA subfamily outer membrane receptor
MNVSRAMLAAGIILVSGGCAPDHLTAPAGEPQGARSSAVGQWTEMANAPLFVVDGNVVQPAAARHLDPNAIASVTVLKGARAVEQFGAAAENGVVVITLKPGGQAMPAPSGQAGQLTLAPAPRMSNPLFVVDGKVMDASSARSIDPNTIESIEVLKGPAAAERYGSQAADGAVIITLKHAAAAGR